MRLLFLWLTAALSLPADVTLRYKIDSPMETALPPGAEPDIQMKAARGVTKLGRLTVIIDVARQEITLVDPDRKTFARFPAAEFEEKSAKARYSPVAAEKTPEPPKFDVKTHKTGRTTTIVGILAEETEATAAIDLGQAGMNLTMHVWTPAAGEVLRLPALREITALNLWYEHFLKVSGGDFEIPGTDGILLRMDMQVRPTGQAIPGFDASQPAFSMTLEATELSTAPLDDSVFTVPEGFTARPPRNC